VTGDLRVEINEKLSWFVGAAYDAFVAQVKPALILATQPGIQMPEERVVQPLSPLRRNALERQVND
jgi:hypothetical protein